MSAFFADFHFVRPGWLLLLLPLALLLWLLARRRLAGGSWEAAIAPELLGYLLEGGIAGHDRRRWALLGTCWLAAVLALAGPAWEKLPQPVLQQRDALVIVLDLSLSMYAEDVSPSRLQRARFKLQDLLDRRDEGVTGLVVYSADAHVVTPLTDDAATIANLLTTLGPDLMPLYGSNPVAGVRLAIELLNNGDATAGRILLATDGISTADIEPLETLLEGSSWQLSILGVGTEQGAPVPLGDALLRDASGNIVVPRLTRDRLQTLAQATNGRYSDLELDYGDLDRLLPPARAGKDDLHEVSRRFDQWHERGPLLVLLLLPVAALGARRGWLLLLPLLALPLSPTSQALEWRDLWLRPDQQGQQAFHEGNMEEAAERFENPAWRGTAHYRAGDYEAAAEAFAQLDNADGYYNRGNALAQAGQLRQALASYDAALALNPALDAARANRETVAELLRRQVEQDANGAPDDRSRDGREGGDSEQSGSKNASGSDQPPRGGQATANAGQPNEQSGQPSGPATPPPDKNTGRADGSQQGPANADDGQADDSEERSGGNFTDSAQHRPDEPESEKPGSSDKPVGQDSASAPADRANAAPAPRDDSPTDDKAPGRTSVTPANRADGQDQPQVAGATDPESSAPPGDVAVEQWLRRIPDDPAGLLRRKFEYESQRRAAEGARPDPQRPLW